MGPFESTQSHKHCFCQIEARDLKGWVQKKYIDRVPTVDLLCAAKNDDERELVALISLLDVDEQVLESTLGHLTSPQCDIVACRRQFRNWVRTMAGVSAQL